MITLLQNVSNSGVSGGDVDGSFGGCGSWGCVVRCRGGHGVRGDDVGDGVVVVVPLPSPPLTSLLLTFCSKVITISIFPENILYFVLAISRSNFAEFQ